MKNTLALSHSIPNLILTLLTLSTLSFSIPSYAAIITNTVLPAEPIKWSSKDFSDEITINNGNSNLITITINVDKVPSATTGANTSRTLPGINLKNCGRTKHVDAGSSAICTTNDAVNPVSFASDSATGRVSGTYSIKY